MLIIRLLWAQVFLALLLVSGCGFHLRGILTMPPELGRLYIEAPNQNTPFVQSLQRMLRVNNITLVSDKPSATAILHLSSIQSSQQLVALSGSSQAGQYQVNSRVKFSLRTVDGKVLLPPTVVTRSGYFNSNATQILSANNMGERLSNRMEQSIAQNIVTQLARVSDRRSDEGAVE